MMIAVRRYVLGLAVLSALPSCGGGATVSAPAAPERSCVATLRYGGSNYSPSPPTAGGRVVYVVPADHRRPLGQAPLRECRSEARTPGMRTVDRIDGVPPSRAIATPDGAIWVANGARLPEKLLKSAWLERKRA